VFSFSLLVLLRLQNSNVQILKSGYPAEKNNRTLPKTIENVMDLMGIVLVLMEVIMCLLVCDGFYWWDVKSYWKNAQNTLQKIIL